MMPIVLLPHRGDIKVGKIYKARNMSKIEAKLLAPYMPF